MTGRRLATALLAAFAAAGLGTGARAAPAAGETVVVTGIVADRAGAPIADLDIVLEASRRRFDVRELRRVPVETRSVSAVSNARGEFSLSWVWADGFDDFRLRGGVLVRRGGGERLVEVAQSDLSRRMRQGGQVVAALEVGDTRQLDSLRQFLAGLQSADERRVYEDLGKPESIDIVRGAGWTEVTWWYFEQGRACRFRDGRLVDVREFDPVRRF